ncbi:MAG: site-specific DNA-methyltransferase [Alphaproteobacteria bacterium]|nr:site-specific DNA-methyltransferase [Alphaproteobacteria bacterium]MBV9863644.1 site-specific DNA-methyltransferase [Alphaproteobacteria bacterium]
MVASPPLPADAVLVGDCREQMARLPPGSVDLVFADPPYNLQLAGELRRPDDSRVDGVEEAWDKFAGFAEYDRFTREWLTACRRLLQPAGALWVIGSYHNIFRIGTLLQDLGFWILNDVVWRKANPMPNFRGRRFTNAHETLLWCARSREARYTFNYEAMKALNEELQMRSDWLIPICGGPERLRDGDGRKAHPTQKPEALLHRVLLASTRPGDIVLDPFFGTGTTGVVAKRLARRFIGIERDPRYVAMARERLGKVEPLVGEAVTLESRRAAPRVPFGHLVERGLLRPGELLCDVSRRLTARVRADGSLISAEHRGSIHAVAAGLLGASACNGWAFWYVERRGELVAIDVFRQQLRAEQA